MIDGLQIRTWVRCIYECVSKGRRKIQSLYDGICIASAPKLQTGQKCRQRKGNQLLHFLGRNSDRVRRGKVIVRLEEVRLSLDPRDLWPSYRWTMVVSALVGVSQKLKQLTLPKPNIAARDTRVGELPGY